MKARVTATPVSGRPGGDCVLDVRAMHEGGSLMIESRQPDDQPWHSRALGRGTQQR